MKRLNNKNRRHLHRIKGFISELNKIEKTNLNETTIRLSVERLFEKIGETINRLSLSNYRGSIFQKYRNFRNEIAHKLEVDTKKIESFIQNLPKLENEIKYLTGEISHSNPTIENFENYGKVGTKENRKQLVDAISDNITSKEDDKVEFPKEPEIKNYSEIIQKIIEKPELVNLSNENEEIAEQISNDIIQWTKETSKQINKTNPFYDEKTSFEEVKQLSSTEFKEKFETIKDYCKEAYSKKEFDTSFYEKKINEIQEEKIKIVGKLDKNGKITHKDSPIDTLRKDFVENWEAKLLDKVFKYELDEIDKAREKFTKELYEKIDQFNKLKELLEPFTNELGRLWDLSGGLWKKTSFDIIKKYSELLKKDEYLKELAEQLGRFRKTEQEFEEEEFEKIIYKQDWKIQNATKSEYVGVHESGDLSSILPSETTLLSDNTTESIFFKKFAEKKLQTFEYQTRFLDTTEEKKKDKRQKVKESDKGPFVICVDTSGSMHGTPEYIAKVLSFAILKIALEEKRKCYLISFSTSIQTMDLADLPNSLDKIVEFLSMSFHGGTDATPALKHAIKMLNTENYKKADVLMISDFIMQSLDETTIIEIEKTKENKSTFHSLTISNNSNQNVINQFDYNWIYNTKNPNAMIELVRQIQTIKDNELK